MKKIMLSCDQATELVEKKLYFRLSLKERIQLSLHLMFCKPCSNYKKQSYLIERDIPKVKFEEVPKENLELFKKEIIKKIPGK